MEDALGTPRVFRLVFETKLVSESTLVFVSTLVSESTLVCDATVCEVFQPMVCV